MPEGSSTMSGSLKARLQEMWFPTWKQLALKFAGTGGFSVLGSMGVIPAPAAQVPARVMASAAAEVARTAAALCNKPVREGECMGRIENLLDEGTPPCARSRARAGGSRL